MFSTPVDTPLETDPGFLEVWNQLFVQYAVLLVYERGCALENETQLFRWRQILWSGCSRADLQSLLETGYADFEKLIEIRRADAQKFQPLEKGDVFVFGLMKDARIELQLSELTVYVVLRKTQVRSVHCRRSIVDCRARVYATEMYELAGTRH